MAKRDLALETARAFVHDTICECGCANSEHSTAPDGYGPCCECDCSLFNPASFTVERSTHGKAQSGRRTRAARRPRRD
jgi:hypothetical protein